MRTMFACLVVVLAVTGCGGSSDAADAWPEENREAFSYACVLGAEPPPGLPSDQHHR